MICSRAQNMITPFINKELNLKDTEAFLNHINHCQNCHEELEVYYVLLTAMKQLDEDKNLSDDYGLELSKELEKAQERVIHAKYTYFQKKAILFLSMILLAFFISFRYSYKDGQDVTQVLESTFGLRDSFRDIRNNDLEKLLQIRLEELDND